jgi:hypothetical protein
MDWLVRLGGDEWSLQGLCEALPKEPRVWKDDDGHYYLSSAALSACADSEGAWDLAELTVAGINDVATVLDRGHHWVGMQAIVHVGDDGSRHVYERASAATKRIWAAQMARRSRLSTTVTRAHPPGHSRLGRLYLVLEKQGDRSDLARALKAWRSRIGRDWGLLYHVYEIIKHNVSGGTDDYKALQAVTPPGMTWPELDDELRRFRGTANDPAHAGPDARHGRPEPKPISDPMSLKEAEDLIRRLLETWIDTKI